MRNTTINTFQRTAYRIVVLLAVAVFATGMTVSGQSISGPTSVTANTTHNYSLFDDVMYANPNFIASNGTIVSQSHSGFNHYVTVTWACPASGTLSFRNGSTVIHTLTATITCMALSTPGASFTYTYNCSNTVITRSVPPKLTNEAWFWQSSSSGTSTANSTTTNTVTTAGTYYLRSRSSVCTSCWSAALPTDHVDIGPKTPVATGASRCGSGQVTLTATPSPNTAGHTIRWYNAPSGGSVLHTGTTYSPSVTGNTTFYASTYNSNSPTCESPQRAPAEVTVDPVSVGGAASSTVHDATGEFSPKGTLTLAGHTGSVVRWEYNTGAGWQLADKSAGKTSWNYFMLPETRQYRAVVKSGSCSEVTSTPVTLEVLHLPYASSLQLTANAGSSYKWFKGTTEISGATQQTHTVNEQGLYTVKLNGATDVKQVFYVFPTMSNNSQKVNAVSTVSILKEGVTASTSLYALEPKEIMQSVSYQDGMGRTFQQIAVGLSPGQTDIVTATGFGKQGLTDTTYLPYVAQARDGRYKKTAIRGTGNTYTTSDQYQFYQNTPDVVTDSYPFARTLHRNTPDAKVTEQGAPGAAWQPGNNHTVRNVMALNNGTYVVKRWKPDGTTTGNYPTSSVVVSITTDENGNKVRTYTNGAGQTVLKQVEVGTSNWLDTYFIYDENGQLKYQVPPKAVEVLGSGTYVTVANLAELIYTYKYDNRGRVIEKKVPGSAVEYIVYDKHDRVALTQNGTLRAQGKWMFIKYDRYNRPVYSGLYTSSADQATLQSTVNALNYDTTPWYETEQGSTAHGYSNNAFPTNTTNTTVLTVNYYDHYDFDRNGTADYTFVTNHLSGQETTAQTNVRNMPTGSKRVVLDAAGNPTSTWLTSAVFYGKYDRPIQTRSNNHLYTTVADISTVIYDFAGRTVKTKSTHYQNASTSVALVDRPEYDHAGRVLRLFRSINGGAEQLLVEYGHNALGQVVTKKLHSTGSGQWLQQVDLTYTIRGWLKQINDPANLGNDYYAQELVYETAGGMGNTPYYNGNISAIKWKGMGGSTSGAEGQRSYKYTYDKSDRLTAAVFQAHGGSSWNAEVNTLNESQAYDKNGNITALTRAQNLKGITVVNNVPTVTASAQTIDNLTYTYASHSTGTQNTNRLRKVEDSITGSAGAAGFVNGANTAEEYTYTTAGSLLKDDNKGISSITYNFLGKPQVVNFTDGRKVDYVYDASGTKLTMKTWQGTTLLTTTNYSGSFVYEGATPQLSYFGSPEGRVVKNGSNFEYQYALADHQGNTRVVFSSVAPAPVSKIATFEGNGGDNSAEFSNVNNVVTSTAANHTPGGSKVVRMNQSYRVGPAKSVRVYAGDVIDAEVWAYYESGSGYGTSAPLVSVIMGAVATAFGGVSAGGGESGAIFNGVDNAFGAFGLAGNQGDNVPAAYLNYILFDQQYNVMNMGWRPVTTASSWAKAKLSFDPINIHEAGFIFVYLSYENESNNWVYFDDFKVTHSKSRIVQYNEYYPFGMQTASSWTRENATGNQFLYNAGSELNNTTSNYEMFFREYDPALGRMNAVDPMASKYASLTPYNYSFNDPVTYNDPSGAEPPQGYGSRSPYHTFYTYDDRVDYYPRGEYNYGTTSSLGSHFGGRSGSLTDWGYSPSSLATVTIGNLTIDLNRLPDGIHMFNFIDGMTNWDLYRGLSGDIYMQQTDYYTNGDRTRYINSQLNILVGDVVIGSYSFHDPNAGFDWRKTWGAYFDALKNQDLIPDWVPVLGSVESMVQAYDRGDGWAVAGNFALAVSDMALVKSIATGIGKGGLKLLGKNYKWWNSTRKFLGTNGFAERGQHVHHWAWARNGAKSGNDLSWWAKNQMWNLKPIPKIEGMTYDMVHKAIEGKILGWPLYKRLYYGMPSWPVTSTISSVGRLID
ncbi:MAG: hypothetical protein KF687_15755 [Cyclobacteriaceae bacterium]|nr:hypothetical protein [Cyclobacteriaceae bacterium]